MRHYRLWWALFVFFGALSVFAVQSLYRRWRRARRALLGLGGMQRTESSRRLRVEGWRLVLMVLSLVAMTGLVFGVFLGASPGVLFVLRLVAVVTVLGVLLLSFRI